MFDARTGRRLSEEFHINPNTDEVDAMLKTRKISSQNMNGESTLVEDGANTIAQKIFADKNARTVSHNGTSKFDLLRSGFQI